MAAKVRWLNVAVCAFMICILAAVMFEPVREHLTADVARDELRDFVEKLPPGATIDQVRTEVVRYKRLTLFEICSFSVDRRQSANRARRFP
jgi:hypothetical protein